jgi:hypothetical protein
VQRQSRDQKTLELLRFDALSGRGRVLITEHNEFWVPLNHELTFCSARRNSSGLRRAAVSSTSTCTAMTAS